MKSKNNSADPRQMKTIKYTFQVVIATWNSAVETV